MVSTEQLNCQDLSELENLTSLLDKASKAYYVDNSPIMSDVEFDQKLKELQKLEAKYNTVLLNSPTHRVGNDLKKEFAKIKHPSPMLTIENTYNDDELVEWISKLSKKYPNKDLDFNVSVKYDGISCELCYVRGFLVSASTRGDKNIGDDITANVRTIQSVPLKLEADIDSQEEIWVRGEILMPKSVLKKTNDDLIDKGLKPFANCRNACSGSVKTLDPSITASRNLIFRPWDIFSNILNVSSQTEKATILEAFGFVYDEGTRPYKITYYSNPSNVACSVQSFYEKIKSLDLDYDYDGIVLKVDDVDLQEEIGTKDNRSIEWGIARKWNEDKEVITKLVGVEFQVGRTGNITPVGKLEPVPCDGVIISNVILNNERYIKDLGIHIGSPVKIVRSGSVIPKLIGKATEEELSAFRNESVSNSEQYDIEFPTTCPECGASLVKEGEIWKCPNSAKCPAQVVGRIVQWCAKDCMNIEGIGPKVAEDLVNASIVTDPLDLYDVATKSSVESVMYALGDGYGKKSVTTIFNNIKASMSKPFEIILYGMGIPNIGKQNAKVLAKEFKSLNALIHASKEELTNVEGIGDVMADNIIEFMADDGVYWKHMLEYYGMSTCYQDQMEEKQAEQILAGLTLVFSGKSAYWDGDQVEVVLSSYGAKCTHAVNKKIDYLIVGEKPGSSKVARAQEFGKEIISEQDFIDKYNIPTKSNPKKLVSNLKIESKEEEKINTIELF